MGDSKFTTSKTPPTHQGGNANVGMGWKRDVSSPFLQCHTLENVASWAKRICASVSNCDLAMPVSALIRFMSASKLPNFISGLHQHTYHDNGKPPAYDAGNLTEGLISNNDSSAPDESQQHHLEALAVEVLRKLVQDMQLNGALLTILDARPPSNVEHSFVHIAIRPRGPLQLDPPADSDICSFSQD